MRNREKKQPNPHRIGVGKMLAWQCEGASVALNAVLLGALQLYCTNALGLSAALVGTILMVTKLVDGVTDLFAGYIVDKTNTKLGRGRPYDLCVLGLWLTTWLMFSVPAEFSVFVKCAWIAVCYTLCQSVFRTFLNASGTAYMVRAFNDDQKYIKINSLGGLMVTCCVIVFNVIFPGMQAQVLSSAPGWSRLIACFALPLGIIGMMRFLFVPEKYDVESEENKNVTVKHIVELLKTNRNIYPVCILQFVFAIATGISVGSYYYLYIVGDLGLMGTMSLLNVIVMPTMLLYPLVMRKLSTTKLVQIGCFMYLLSGPIGFIAKDNLVLLAISSLIAGCGMLPISYMSGLFIIDCADYNEWQNRPRMEGTLGAITGFANKIGSAFSSFLLGVLLSASGFDGTQTVQTPSALLMIRFANSMVPMIFMVIAGIALLFFGIDRIKPVMTKELEERRRTRE
ncbi:MAG: MFS transporter [Eubacteriales bacterium]|nr:MFS transporter [Eubacteriales bacterium]